MMDPKEAAAQQKALADIGLEDVTHLERGGIGGNVDANGNSRITRLVDEEVPFDPEMVAAGQKWREHPNVERGRVVETVEKLDPTDLKPERWLCTYEDADGSTGEAELAPRAFANLFLLPPELKRKPRGLRKILDGVDLSHETVEMLDRFQGQYDLARVQGTVAGVTTSLRAMTDGCAGVLQATANRDPAQAIAVVQGLMLGAQATLRNVTMVKRLLQQMEIEKLSEDDRLILASMRPLGDADSIPFTEVIEIAAKMIKGPTGTPDIVTDRIRLLAGLELIEVEQANPNVEPTMRLSETGMRIMGY